ncbi:flagellar biosynthesis protein FlhB [Rubrivivax gelatinosus]|uniref:flagellar type III secretion system protein FlhB n=1 Tax=Rubrivivax gelatinosus TaxID=28068 RepID=UPI001907BE3D|nr:flagellar type III secretion system protein FlhB [Rubrivivax gelatinosus]MBK1616107.1 flagellar biosynthesis protein FlhB [Rubrivivax gelatinosus]
MAEAGGGDKTEKATPNKLRKAREQGQVARSRDWATAAGIVVGLQVFVLLLPAYLEDFRLLFGAAFVPLDGDGALAETWSTLFATAMLLLLKMVLPLLAVPLLAVIAGLVPGGWTASSSNLQPKPERLNPVSNLGRLFGARHLAEFAGSLLKTLALGAVLWHVAAAAPGDYLRLQGMTLERALAAGLDLVRGGVLALVAVFVIFALIDLPLQVFLFRRQQRMSKQEVKEEHKTSEGRPEVRQRIRQLQRQLAQRSVRKAVPGADVVVVNPEHYAVALKYDERRAQAPYVVAKGVDEMALYIRGVAVEHAVQVVEAPPLARAIYHTSQVNQQIPAALYRAVALVLGYVMQLQAFRSGRRASSPQLPNELPVPPHLAEKPSR